jgi:serine/threonine protein kinase/WD40 repeat protein
MPSSDSSGDVVLERLAAEFVERHRRGERPPLSEYADRYPDLAGEIRALFPALVQIEKLKPATDATGAFEPTAISSGSTKLELLGDYRIVREVGRGGMGVVYEAEQVSLGRHVALKVLPGQAPVSPTYLERFRREAKAAARLHHTNIVPVFGVGEHDGVHYYAMQYIAGEGLDRVLHDLRRLRGRGPGAPAGPPPASVAAASAAASLLSGRFAAPAAPPGPADDTTPLPHREPSQGSLSADPSGSTYYRSVARIGAQVADALAYAHQQGVLHRDVKPSNLLLDAQGTVWVTDFGLAKAEGADELTQTGDIVGTVRYMAPERFDGTSLPQGDVYGVGLTLYELLTLRPAFDDGNRARLIERMLHEPPVPPRKLDRGIPHDLETVVLKCLARDPAGRYPTAAALAEDLRRFLGDRPIRARRTSWPEHTWRWCRRNPAVATLLGLVALLLVALTAGTLVANARLRSSLHDANQAKDSANQARDAADVRLWESLRDRARAVRMSGRVGQRLDALRSVREALALPLPPGHTLAELRTEAVAALALPDLEVEKEWEGNPTGTMALAFDARVEVYARVTRDATVSVRRVADDVELAHWKEDGFDPFLGNGAEWGLTIAPDGLHVAVCHYGLRLLRVRRLDGEQAAVIHEAEHVAPWSLRAFSPDGARLAYAREDGHVAVLDLGTRAERLLPEPLAGPEWLRISPDGGQLAVCTWVNGRWGVEVRDLASGALTARLSYPGFNHHFPAWHPDGQMLATFGDDQLIRLWDVPSGKLIRVLEGHRQAGGVLAFDRSSGLLLSNDWSGILRVWDPPSGRQLLSLTATNYPYLYNQVDGRVPAMKAATTETLQVLRLHPARAYHTLSGSPNGASGGFDDGEAAPVFSVDGRFLFAPTHSQSTTGRSVLDAATGRELGVIPFVDERPFHWVAGGGLLTAGRTGVLLWPATPNARGTTASAPPRSSCGGPSSPTAAPAETAAPSPSRTMPGAPWCGSVNSRRR